ncbi:MAG TPA: hypothetical protein VIK45_21400 [Candidatus Dormibacteraeota bacterium]
MSQQELQEIADDYKQIAGFEMEELNNRPSRSVGLGTPQRNLGTAASNSPILD